MSGWRADAVITARICG